MEDGLARIEAKVEAMALTLTTLGEATHDHAQTTTSGFTEFDGRLNVLEGYLLEVLGRVKGIPGCPGVYPPRCPWRGGMSSLFLRIPRNPIEKLS